VSEKKTPGEIGPEHGPEGPPSNVLGAEFFIRADVTSMLLLAGLKRKEARIRLART